MGTNNNIISSVPRKIKGQSVFNIIQQMLRTTDGKRKEKNTKHFSENLEVQFFSNLGRKKSIKIDSRDKSLTQNILWVFNFLLPEHCKDSTLQKYSEIILPPSDKQALPLCLLNTSVETVS